jgi:AcrR family transcriptional regulator
MSQIAEQVGIGRATLYKYFPDVDAILSAWHEREITDHLSHLEEIYGRGGDPVERLADVLEGYAHLGHRAHGHRESDLAAFLHRDERVSAAEWKLRKMITDLIAEGVRARRIRHDVAPEELANYCLHALSAARGLSSKPAVRRLVAVTLAGLAAR